VLTITRRQARSLGSVLRRRTLGIPARGPCSPLVFRPTASGLQVRLHAGLIAVETALPGHFADTAPIALPLEVLADIEGRDDAPVEIETSAERTVVRWTDHGIPRVQGHDVPAIESLPPWPELPAKYTSMPGCLLDAMAAAAEVTTHNTTRYALDCIALDGNRDAVIGTDGRQLVATNGFHLPWRDSALVHPCPVLSSKALPRDKPIGIARTSAWIILRAGTWTLWFAVQEDARFPETKHVLPGDSQTKLQLDPADAAFLAGAIGRLPGGDDTGAPITIDCNGAIAVRARALGEDHPTDVVLTRSRYTGQPGRTVANRNFLIRALRLGFSEIGFTNEGTAAVCSNGQRTYGFMPLSDGAAVEPTVNTLRIESTTAGGKAARAASATEKPRTRMKERSTPDGHSATPNGAPVTEASLNAPTLAALMTEAEALHSALGDARGRTARLIAGLRRYRRRSRLMEGTLKALQELKLQDVAQ
jgi:hypothetical protein